MRRIVTTPPVPPKDEAQELKPPEPKSSDVDLDELQDKTRLILYREIRWLMASSDKGPLTKDESAALVHYAKLIKDLKRDEGDALKNIPDEDLAKIAKK